MKTSFSFQTLALFAALLPLESVAAPKKPMSQAAQLLPAEVRRALPLGARSLYLSQHPIGDNGRKLLVHLWATPRGGREGRGASLNSGTSNFQFDPSPFCLDVYDKTPARSADPGQWNLTSTTVYKGQTAPDPRDVSVRWLNPPRSRRRFLSSSRRNICPRFTR